MIAEYWMVYVPALWATKDPFIVKGPSTRDKRDRLCQEVRRIGHPYAYVQERWDKIRRRDRKLNWSLAFKLNEN